MISYIITATGKKKTTNTFGIINRIKHFLLGNIGFMKPLAK